MRWRDLANDTADFAVVELDGFAGANAVEKLGKRDADARRADQAFFLVVLCRTPGVERSREDECVTYAEPQRLGLWWNCGHSCDTRRACDSSAGARLEFKREAGND